MSVMLPDVFTWVFCGYMFCVNTYFFLKDKAP